MSIVTCRECKANVSTEAATCPHCGCSNPAKKAKSGGGLSEFLRLLLIAAILLFGYLIFIATPSKAPPTAQTPAPAAAPTPPAPPPMTAAQIDARDRVAQIKDDDYCGLLGKTLRAKPAKSAEYRQAMIDRALAREGMNYDMVNAIEQRRPLIGMTTCAVLAAVGKPTRANRSVGSYGEHYQLIYENPRIYIYLENGTVKSWQD